MQNKGTLIESNRMHNKPDMYSQNSYRESLKIILANLLPKLSRAPFISKIMLIIHMVEILSQSLPQYYSFDSKFIPILHGYLIPFAPRIYGEKSRLGILCLFSGLNSLFLISLLVLLRLEKLRGYNFFKISAQFFLINITRIYIPLLMVPILNLSSSEIYSGLGEAPILLLAGFVLVSTIFISLAISLLQVNYGFLINDHMSSFPGSGDIVVLLLKIACSLIFFQERMMNVAIVTVLFFILVVEYSIRIPFYDRSVSQLYLVLCTICFLVGLIYSLILLNLVDEANSDPTLFLLIGSSLFIRMGRNYRELILRLRIFNKNVFAINDNHLAQLLSLELKYKLEYARNSHGIEECADVMNIITYHHEKCQDKICECQTIDFSAKLNWSKMKKLMRSSLGDIFRKSLATRWADLQQVNILNICAFTLAVEKLPNKALNLLYKYESKITSFNNQIALKIINQKAHQLYETRLKGMKEVFLNCAELMMFEGEVEDLEKLNREFLMKFMEFMINLKPIKDEAMGQYTQFALSQGAELIHELSTLKKKTIAILTKNPESLRVLGIALRLMRLFDDDGEFQNEVRRLEIKRIHIIRAREKQVETDSNTIIDIFNPSAGVLFLNMTDAVGRIEKASKSISALFKTSANNIIGVNIKHFMPDPLAVIHDGLLLDFLNSDRTALVRQKDLTLFALDKQRFLVNIHLNIRVDNYFRDTFLMSGLLTKAISLANSLICDELGNILHFTEELNEKLGLLDIKNKGSAPLFNICELIPQFFWLLFPKKKMKPSDSELLDIKALLTIPKPDLLRNRHRGTAAGRLKAGLKNDLSIFNDDPESLALLFLHILRSIDSTEQHFWGTLNVKFVTLAGKRVNLILITFADLVVLDEEIKISKLRSSRFEGFNSVPSFLESNVIKKVMEMHLIEVPRILNNTLVIDSQPLLTENKDASKKYKIEIPELPEEELGDQSNDEEGIENKKQKLKSFTVYLPNSAQIPNHSELETSKALIAKKETEEKQRENYPHLPMENEPAKVKGKNIKMKLSLQNNAQVSLSKLNMEKNSIPLDSGISENSKSREIPNQKTRDFHGATQSEASSSASSGSMQSKVSALFDAQTREMRIMRCLILFIFALIISVMFFSWQYNISKVNSILTNLESSLFIQDLVMPLSLLMKNYVIFDFQKRDLFYETGSSQPLFEYINFVQSKTRNTTKKAFNTQLRSAPFAAIFLQERWINMAFPVPEYGIEDYEFKKTNLEQAYSQFQMTLMDYENPGKTEREYDRSFRFLMKNYLPFLKEFMFIFEDIVSDVNSTMKTILNVSVYIFAVFFPLLMVIFLHMFYCSYKIKAESQRLTWSLKHFDKDFLQEKINQIAKCISELYPSLAMEMKLIMNQPLTSMKFSSRNELPKVSSSPKLGSAKRREKEGVGQGLASFQTKRRDRISTFSVRSMRSFITLLILGLTFLYILPAGVFVINNLLLTQFNGKVNKIVTTKEGIQQFTISFTSLATIKQLNYSLSLNSTPISLKAMRGDFSTYFVKLNQVMKANSNPGVILNKEDEYPELLKINSEFYFKDVCDTLTRKNISIDFTDRYNSQTCILVFNGVLQRGIRSLSMELNNIFNTWDLFIAMSTSIEAGLKEHVLNNENFNYLQNSLNILKTLEEQQLKEVSSVLEDYLRPFQTQQNIWLGVGLSLILLLYGWALLVLLKILIKTYLISVSLLKIFPSRMIFSNKVLLARIDELFRRT